MLTTVATPSTPITLADDRLPVLLLRHRDGGIARRVAIDRLPFLVGSAADVDLSLPAATVSRLHASFHWLGGQGMVVKDEASRNGTHVNGEPSSERALQAGDVVKIGPFLLELQLVNLGATNDTEVTTIVD